MVMLNKCGRKSYLPERKAQGRRRHENTAFYQSQRWRRVRHYYIAEHPLCEECKMRGITTPARVVDHIKPINEGGDCFDISNLQALCDRCHNKKSGREAHRL